MITKLSPRDESEVLGFIGDDYRNCLYLYANLAKYDLGNSNMSMWKIENDEILVGVAQKYFSCIHFYCSKDNWLTKELADFIKQENPRTILATQEISESLYEKLESNFLLKLMNLYYVSSEIIITSEKYSNQSNSQLEKAKKEDIGEITDFLMQDTAYKKNYTKCTLFAQLNERLIDEYSRYYIIRKYGKIIATVSTKAEHSNFAVIGGVMVDKKFRQLSIGKYITSDITKILQNEGKECYSFISSENMASIRMFEKVGFKRLGTYGKLIAIS